MNEKYLIKEKTSSFSHINFSTQITNYLLFPTRNETLSDTLYSLTTYLITEVSSIWNQDTFALSLSQQQNTNMSMKSKIYEQKQG
jgi:hypothetical protein